LLKKGKPYSGRTLEPLDVAKAVLFFAGEATGKVTGEVFDVSYGSLSQSIA